jgi:glucose/arabinose dehydrogenase
MRSRISALVLSAILVISFAACSKKDQSQNQSTMANGAASSAQANQPATTTPATNPPAQNQQAMSAPAQQQQQQMAPAQQQPPQQQQMAQAPPPPPPPPPPPLVVPAGTSLVVRVGNTIDTKTANPGDSFTGVLAHSVAVGGVVAIPAGAGVAGTVVDAKSPGRFKGEGILSISLTSVNVRGVPTTISSSTYTQTIKGKGKRTAVAVGGGTGAGALIGGIAGGGKGALIGGLVGAGAGTAGAAFTGNKDLQIPAESVVTFKLASSITVKRVQKQSTGDQPTPQ